jgi:hypothetical protein
MSTCDEILIRRFNNQILYYTGHKEFQALAGCIFFGKYLKTLKRIRKAVIFLNVVFGIGSLNTPFWASRNADKKIKL